MYNALLACHSIFRWLVLVSLIVTVLIGIRGWLTNKRFTKVDNQFRHWTATIVHIQFLIGILLYYISPIIRNFFENFKEAVKLREIRFFGMEHSLMMLIAITLVTIGSYKAKRGIDDISKYKTMVLFFGLGLIIICLSIPWKFSAFVSRPYFRFF